MSWGMFYNIFVLIGSIVAGILSWGITQSILWTAWAVFLGWIYVIYYVIFYLF